MVTLACMRFRNPTRAEPVGGAGKRIARNGSRRSTTGYTAAREGRTAQTRVSRNIKAQI